MAGERIEPLLGGGTTGNERLTAATGVLLLLPLAVIGVTLLSLHGLMSVHLFVGMLLIPPILLKLASTGYRFVRYYTHNPRYRRKGPPQAFMRAIAPVVALSTVIVLASGVALLAIGPSSRDQLLPIHKVAFIVWVAFTALHVLGHLPELPRALSRKRESVSVTVNGGDGSTLLTHPNPPAGGVGRTLSLSGAVVGGVVLAIVFIPDFAPWLNLHHQLVLNGGR